MALRTISGRYRDLDKVGYNVADICCPSGRLIRSVSDCAWNENASTLSTRRDPHQRISSICAPSSLAWSGVGRLIETSPTENRVLFSFLFFSFPFFLSSRATSIQFDLSFNREQ